MRSRLLRLKRGVEVPSGARGELEQYTASTRPSPSPSPSGYFPPVRFIHRSRRRRSVGCKALSTTARAMCDAPRASPR